MNRHGVAAPWWPGAELHLYVTVASRWYLWHINNHDGKQETYLKKKNCFIMVIIRFLHNPSEETKPLLCIFCYILFSLPDHYLQFKKGFQGDLWK